MKTLLTVFLADKVKLIPIKWGRGADYAPHHFRGRSVVPELSRIFRMLFQYEHKNDDDSSVKGVDEQ